MDRALRHDAHMAAIRDDCRSRASFDRFASRHTAGEEDKNRSFGHKLAVLLAHTQLSLRGGERAA